MIAICTPVVRVVSRVALALAVLGIATAAFADPEGAASGNVVRAPRAPNIGPLTNSVVGNARLLVPDGTSVLGDFASDTQRWYAVGIEPGKTYVIDACAFPATLNVGTLHVNTYAFNPAINQYLVFTPWSANGGANANSF